MGNLLVDFLALFGRYHLDELGRYACPKLVCPYLGAGCHHTACSNDGSFAYLGIVEQYAPHADEGIVVHLCTMDGDVVAHRDVVANLYS